MGVLERLRGLRHRPAAPHSASPALEGFVDERSVHHVAGWLMDPARPAAALGLAAVLQGSGEILARGVADQFKFGPSTQDKGMHGFYLTFPRRLRPEERDQVVVVPDEMTAPLLHAPYLSSAYEPVMLVAMDIVDNCNLRCPFCLYDYSAVHSTHFMTGETLAASIRFAPYTLVSNFWFSCLHEPTLHPRFLDFLDLVPRDDRRKVFFTTNLAKRMPRPYFERLADSGIANLNISIESLDPAVYERMRKGAKHRIFLENWDALIATHAQGKAPPFLRYIAMVYKSNLAEMPRLVAHLFSERRAGQVQLRFTFDVPFIAADFRAAEFLDDADWDWLVDQMSIYPAGKVEIVLPPRTDAATLKAPAQGVYLPGRYEFKLAYDGTLLVNRFWAVPYDGAMEDRVAEVNVRDIADPLDFIASLPR
jgi:MoaA/NifB/PqqE/SkfB family radical SAM enzyme